MRFLLSFLTGMSKRKDSDPGMTQGNSLIPAKGASINTLPMAFKRENPSPANADNELVTIKIYKSDWVRIQKMKRSVPSNRTEPSHAQVVRDALNKLQNVGLSPSLDQIKTDIEEELLRKLHQFESNADPLTRDFTHQVQGIPTELADQFRDNQAYPGRKKAK